MMIKIVRSIKIFSMICIIVAALTACGDKEFIVEKNIIDMPTEDFILTSLDYSDDEGLIVSGFVQKDEQSIILSAWSSNNDTNWEAVYEKEFQCDKNQGIEGQVYWSSNGGLIIPYTWNIDAWEEGDYSLDEEYYYVDELGNAQQIVLAENVVVGDVAFSKDGKLYCTEGLNFNLIECSPYQSGNTSVIELQKVDSVHHIKTTGEQLYVLGFGGKSAIYDMTKGTEMASTVNFEQMSSDILALELAGNEFAFCTYINPQKEECIFYVDSYGLWKYKNGEKINLLSEQDANFVQGETFFHGLAVKDEYTIYVSFFTENNGVFEDQTVRYDFTGGSSKTADNNLTVYMLTENEELVSVIRSFSENYPEVSFTFEYGIEDTFKTSSEALKELNTRLLAGDGPDIIILDDMNARKYAEKGQLLEITEIIDDVSDELVPNVIDSNLVDNKLYYIPLYVSLVSQSWDKGISVDFSTAENMVSDIGLQDLDIKNTSYDNIAALLYRTEIEPVIKETGTVDKDTLKQFYRTLEELMQLYDGTIDFASFEQMNLKVNHLYQFLTVAEDECGAAIDYIDTTFAVQSLYSLQTQDLMDFKFVGDEKGYSYIPSGVISIYKGSSSQALAKELVDYMLSDEGQQKLIEKQLIPVNLSALKEWLKVDSQTNIMDGPTIYPLTEEDEQNFLFVMEHLKLPLASDSNLAEIIMGGAQLYLNGEDSLDNAVNITMKKTEIYLSE